MGILIVGLTMLLWPAVSSSRVIRKEWHPSQKFTIIRYYTETYLASSKPVPVRFASRVHRGPSPADPLAARDQAESEAAFSEAIPDASGQTSGDEADAFPDMGLPDLTPIYDESLRAALEAAADPRNDRPTRPDTLPAAEEATRRLYLEAPLPRARLEEILPSFELPVGKDGETLRLPIIRIPGGSTIDSGPSSSATYHQE